MVTLIFALLATSLCFGVLLQVPPRWLLHATVISTFGGIAHSNLLPISNTQFTAAIAAFTIGCMSHLVARITGQPAQIFLVPGVIVLVPGSLIYETMSRTFDGNLSSSIEAIPMILMTAVSLSFGLLLANWLVPSRREL